MSLEMSPAGARSEAVGPAPYQGTNEAPVHAITILAARSLNQPQSAATESERLLADAYSHCHNQRWEQLNETCDELMAQGLQNEWVIGAKARACHDLGRWDDYLTLCRRLLQAKPENLEYLQGTIRGCMNTQRYVDAIQHLSHLVSAAQETKLKKWALTKRQEACMLLAEADALAISSLIPPGVEDIGYSNTTAGLTHSP